MPRTSLNTIVVKCYQLSNEEKIAMLNVRQLLTDSSISVCAFFSLSSLDYVIIWLTLNEHLYKLTCNNILLKNDGHCEFSRLLFILPFLYARNSASFSKLLKQHVQALYKIEKNKDTSKHFSFPFLILKIRTKIVFFWQLN